MKKILFAILFFFSLTSFKEAGAQKLKFYYYPSSNVYYNTVDNQYVYMNNGNWVNGTALPANINVKNSRRVIVYNPNPKVWENNSVHVKKYKNNYPNGKAVGYKGTNPNKSTTPNKGTNPNKAHGKTKANGHQ